jgi:hypothetical protein
MIFSKNSAGPVGKAIIVMIDFLALVAQTTVFFVIMGTEYTAFIEKAMYTTQAPTTSEVKPVDISFDPFAESSRQVADMPGMGDVMGGGGAGNGFGEKPSWKGSWEAPFALLFTSVIWWENYVDRDIKLGIIRLPFATYKRHLQAIRSKANIGASLWKIALTIAFSVILLPSKKFENAFVKLPTAADVVMSTMGPNPMNGPVVPGGAGGMPGDNVIDYGGFDSPFDGGARIKRDIVSTTTEAPLISAAMNLEGILTVPNNAWNPTTPNLFDFIASKVKFVY